MEQSTQTNTPGPTAQTDPRLPDESSFPARAAYRRASALAGRIVNQLSVMPRAIEQFTEVGSCVYRVRLWFGYGLDAGRAVLEVAEQADAEVVQDRTASGVFVEARASMDGIPIIARALLTKSEAAKLSDESAPTDEEPLDPAPTVQPVPLGASVIAVTPAVAAATGGAE
ncbi:hypothetical protein [Streptomyces sp. NPDC001914]|uniref:hypothetical protein n=1 Tax=Streptomyces sp. NPDC001914 TaxID=3364623 RepID=UPI0036D14EF1